MNNYKSSLYRYPAIDLHGETRDTMIQPLDDFINDNIKLQNKFIAVIHGRGQGILKKQTYLFLKKDKRILRFYTEMFNPGCTIVELDIDKKN